MTSTSEIIRRIWDEGRLTTADIAEMTGTKEADVSRVVAEHVARKARTRSRKIGGAA